MEKEKYLNCTLKKPFITEVDSFLLNKVQNAAVSPRYIGIDDTTNYATCTLAGYQKFQPQK
jgi:hypothetical protein